MYLKNLIVICLLIAPSLAHSALTPKPAPEGSVYADPEINPADTHTASLLRPNLFSDYNKHSEYDLDDSALLDHNTFPYYPDTKTDYRAVIPREMWNPWDWVITKNNYNGVVQLKGPWISATAVFVTPDTLVTAAHVITNIKGSLKENLFFIDPKTGKQVHITNIHQLDLKYDIAVLKTAHYRSDVFYPPALHPAHRLQAVTAVGFKQKEHKAIAGHVLFQSDLFVDIGGAFINMAYGFSGGPVFNSNTGELIGIVLSQIKKIPYVRTLSSKKIVELLSLEPLSCDWEYCVKQELENLRVKALRDPLSAFRLSRWHRTQGNNILSNRLLNRAAKQGVPAAQFVYAEKYSNESVDDEKALRYYVASAKQGFLPAYGALSGICLDRYLDGKITDVDCFDMLELTAYSGYAPVEFSYGMMFFLGIGVDGDYATAVEFIEKAVAQGYLAAKIQLGLMYYAGEGVEQNKDRGLFLIRSAAEHGSVEASDIIDLIAQ